MARHPFDPISLVFGLVFAAAGMIVLLDGSLVDQGAFLVPTGLIALGLALLYEARRKSVTAAAADEHTAGAPVRDLGLADPVSPAGEEPPGAVRQVTAGGVVAEVWPQDPRATGRGPDEAGAGLAGEDGPGDEVGAEGGEDGEVEEPGGRHDR